MNDELTRLRAENAKLKSELEQAQKVVAAMREALEAELATHGHNHWDSTMQYGAGCPKCIAQRAAGEKSRTALYSDNGKDYVHRSELDKSERGAAELLTWATMLANDAWTYTTSGGAGKLVETLRLWSERDHMPERKWGSDYCHASKRDRLRDELTRLRDIVGETDVALIDQALEETKEAR